MTGKPLDELNVQPGDVVQMVTCAGYLNLGNNYKMLPSGQMLNLETYETAPMRPYAADRYTIISRASCEGDWGPWEQTGAGFPVDGQTVQLGMRRKIAPKVERHVLYWGWDKGAYMSKGCNDTHRLTFTRIGEDVTVKMEKL